MDLGLKGKKALVTGADSGIGWHTVQQLVNEGVDVMMTDQDESQLKVSAEKIYPNNGKVFTYPADITKLEDIHKLHQATREQLGSIDILIQSAGITGAQGLFHEIDDAGWRHTIEVDLLGPVRVVKEFIGDLREGGWGRLIFLASEDGVQPYDDELPYCSAKAGILALAKGLSRSYAREGLLVNAVSPAFIHTPMTDVMMQKRSKALNVSFDEAIKSFLKEERPYMELGRRGEPEEVAAVIVFLCSECASFINGANFRVDSGSVATI